MTDQGIQGIGEAYSCGPDMATVAVIEDFKGWLVDRIHATWSTSSNMMYNFTRFPGGWW